MTRSRLAKMVGLVLGQLVVLVMLTGGAWADAGAGGPRAAEGQSSANVVAAPTGDGCQTVVFICETLADLASPAVLASSAQAFTPGPAWVAPGYADRVPTELASAGSVDYCIWFVCETLADLASPTVIASAPASPEIMLADPPGSPKLA